MKRIFGLVLALAMLLTMSAVAFAEEPVTIEFYCVKPEVTEVFEEIIADFEALNPGINVEVTFAADGETVLKTRIASNEIPDTMSLFPAEQCYRDWLDEGYVVNMTNEAFMSNVAQSMIDLAAYNGEQMSLPYTLSMYGVYYNTEIFAELGLEVPTTVEALIDCCAKIKEAGYDAFALPMIDCAQICERVISAFDGQNYVEMNACAAGEIGVRDIKAISALADFILAIKPYSTADAMGMNNDAAHNDFMNRKAAMRLQGSWYLSTVELADPEFPLGLFGIPSPIYNDVIIPVNIDTGFSVSASTEHPEEAMKFVEYLSTTEAATKYYTVDGNINMVNGVEYDKAPHMDVYNQIMSGKMSLTQINFWQGGSAMRSAIAAAAQELYMTEDLDTYFQMIEDAIIELSE